MSGRGRDRAIADEGLWMVVVALLPGAGVGRVSGVR